MSTLQIGILHPGQMGISVAASARDAGHTVFWASEGRSAETRARAEGRDLRDAGSLAALCAACDALVCVCPPHAAEDVAAQVAAEGFGGLYVDANAIAPQRAQRIARAMAEAGIRFVDGSIVGGPAWEPGRTWLYLSGPHAAEVPALFEGGPLETAVLSERIGDASALKMCFAAYTKGSAALLCAIAAAAETLGVREALEHQWARSGSDFALQARRRVTRVTAKAWRFAGEMDEIAATFQDAGQPEGFYTAAAEVYRRIAHFKGADPLPVFEEVLEALGASAAGEDASSD